MPTTTSLTTLSPRDTTEQTVDHRREEDDTTLFRIINTTDAAVDVTVDQTDGYDDGYAHTESAATPTVSAGAVTTVTVSEPWVLFRFGITPQTAPTTGTVEIRKLR